MLLKWFDFRIKIKPPILFEIENLEKNLNPENYLYVLNRNCTLFEADNPIFIKTAHFVYNHVIDNGSGEEN